MLRRASSADLFGWTNIEKNRGNKEHPHWLILSICYLLLNKSVCFRCIFYIFLQIIFHFWGVQGVARGISNLSKYLKPFKEGNCTWLNASTMCVCKNVVNREAKQMQGRRDKIKGGEVAGCVWRKCVDDQRVDTLVFKQLNRVGRESAFTGPPSVLRLPSPRGQSWALR